MPAAEVADEELTGCLGSAVGVDWIRGRALDIGFATLAVEHVVRAEMNQAGSHALGDESQVPSRNAVDVEGLIDVRLASLDLVKGSRVDDHGRLEPFQNTGRPFVVTDV